MPLISNDIITIVKDEISVKQTPNSKSDTVVTLPKGTKVPLIKEQDGWYLVRIDNQTQGWIPEWFLSNTSLNSEHNITAEITNESPVYETTDTTSSVVFTARKDLIYTVLEVDSHWVKIIASGQSGYIPIEVAELGHQEATVEQIIAPDKITIDDGIERIQVRQANQFLFTEPDVYSNIIYTIDFNQRFKLIEEAYNDYGATFYLVEDDNGTRGYVESRVAAPESLSDNHVTRKSTQSIQGALIMLDPGHGGEDAGASDMTGTVLEKNINLNTALALKAKLEAMGATVMMSRNDDVFLDLSDISAQSNEQKVDAFISIHYNALDDTSIRGTETYYYHGFDYAFAKSVNDALSTYTLANGEPLVNNGIIFGDYQVLRQNNRQAILIELGYLTNKEDAQLVNTTEYQEAIAQKVAEGVRNYFNTND